MTGRAEPWRSSRRRFGSGSSMATALGDRGGKGLTCAIRATRADWVVPSTSAAGGTAPGRRLEPIWRFLGIQKSVRRAPDYGGGPQCPNGGKEHRVCPRNG